MASQKKLFLDCEGDGWFSRNRIEGEKLAKKLAEDPVLEILSALDLSPRAVLEIGASNGWRIAALRDLYPEAAFSGVEPSAEAVRSAPAELGLKQGTADQLPFPEGAFDLVIYGFCLYLCDREDLFCIAAEGDRVLRDGGHLVIYDFCTPQPYRNPYAHQPGAYSYKMNYSRLFDWNPAYKTVRHDVMLHPGCTEDKPDNNVGVTILRKQVTSGWQDNPCQG